MNFDFKGIISAFVAENISQKLAILLDTGHLN